MRQTKQDYVATSPDNNDLLIYLHFWRGDEMVAAVATPLDRDKGLQAALLGSTGFAADTVSITFEGYHTTYANSPITGKPWMPNEMQFVYQTMPEATEKGWIIESLNTSIHQRGGAYLLQSQAFTISNGTVDWREESVIDPHHELTSGGGLMFDTMQDAISAPTIEERVAEAEDGGLNLAAKFAHAMDAETRQFHYDAACLAALQDRELAIAIILHAPRGSTRHRLIEERFGDHDNSGPFTIVIKEI